MYVYTCVCVYMYIYVRQIGSMNRLSITACAELELSCTEAVKSIATNTIRNTALEMLS